MAPICIRCRKSISESGAIQCGFCTPGIVMEIYGLLEKNPMPARWN